MVKLAGTHTFATLLVSAAAYDEVRGLLEKAGYQHAFTESGAIDMQGIGLVRTEDGMTQPVAQREER